MNEHPDMSDIYSRQTREKKFSLDMHPPFLLQVQVTANRFFFSEMVGRLWDISSLLQTLSTT